MPNNEDKSQNFDKPLFFLSILLAMVLMMGALVLLVWLFALPKPQTIVIFFILGLFSLFVVLIMTIYEFLFKRKLMKILFE